VPAPRPHTGLIVMADMEDVDEIGESGP
jgi:hypothetical protein